MSWRFAFMQVVISDEIAKANHLSEPELKLDLAILLYKQNKLSLAQAADIAGVDRFKFQKLLAHKHIPINYDLADYEHDVKTLKDLGQL
jgi:predicted HTH domain antitoxin